MDYFATRKNRVNDNPRRLALILISDGVERYSQNKLEQVLKYLRGEGIGVFAKGSTRNDAAGVGPAGHA